ncbi:MAG: hypothetical protein QM731_06210 [Chitinophagaceae bacterium]
MFSTVLDVAIGLVLIFLLYSLLTTSIQEAIATILHRRANTLYKGIRAMLTNTKESKGALADFFGYIFVYMWGELKEWIKKLFTGNRKDVLYNDFYNHPIIKNYGQNLLFKKPSYLTAENFSTILTETLKDLHEGNHGKTVTFAMLKEVLDRQNAPADLKKKEKELAALGNKQLTPEEKAQQTKDLQDTITRLKATIADNTPLAIDAETLRILTFHLNEAAGDLDVLKYRLGKWYDDTMDRVSGWYKRNTQFWLFGMGIILAVMLNIDSIEISGFLSDNKPAREQMAQMGVAAAGNKNYAGNDTIAKEVMDSVKAQLKTVNTLVGLGWGDYGASDSNFRKYILDHSWFTCGMIDAYKNNKDSAEKYFTSIREKASLAIVAAQTDTANKHRDQAIALSIKISDSIINNHPQIVAQHQFSMLYGNEDYDNPLKRRYVICYRLWSFRKWLGFLITAFAISLGSPFWFDLLNKFVSIRAAVKSVNSSGSTTKNNDTSNNSEIDG